MGLRRGTGYRWVRSRRCFQGGVKHVSLGERLTALAGFCLFLLRFPLFHTLIDRCLICCLPLFSPYFFGGFPRHFINNPPKRFLRWRNRNRRHCGNSTTGIRARRLLHFRRRNWYWFMRLNRGRKCRWYRIDGAPWFYTGMICCRCRPGDSRSGRRRGRYRNGRGIRRMWYRWRSFDRCFFLFIFRRIFCR